MCRAGIFIAFLLITLSVSSQDFIGNGDYYKKGKYRIVYTIGEPINDLYIIQQKDEPFDSNFYYKQGFIHPTNMHPLWWWIWHLKQKWGWEWNNNFKSTQIVFKVFPNPATEFILYKVPEPMRYRLFDFKRTVVRQGTLIETTGHIDLRGLRNATYILQLYNVNYYKTFKIIKL